MSKFLIIDGNSLMYRAYFALPDLMNSEGLHTNAIYGFSMMLLKLLDEEKPDYIAVAFDKKAPTFRHKEYSAYKGTRQSMPEELIEQVDILKDVINAFNIKTIEIEGFEADDIIGTVSKIASENGLKVLIVTGDRDALQLVSDGVKVKICKKGITQMEEYDERAVVERYEVTPRQFIDLKGLMGDKSDNIPGVPNIGEKTAIKLIKEFGSIENVLMNTDKLKGKIRENIENNTEMAMLSKKLATIERNVPIEIDLSEYQLRDYDREKLIDLFEKLEFTSLINDLKKDADDIREVKEWPVRDFKYIRELLKREDTLSFYPLILEGEVKAVSFATDDESFFVEVDDYEVFKLLDNEKLTLIGHDIKDFFVNLSYHGIELNCKFYDTAIMTYLLNPSESNYDIGRVLKKYLKEDIPNIEDMLGKGKSKKSYDDIDKKLLIDYLCATASKLSKLKDKLMSFIKEMEMEELLDNVELPLVEVLKSMEVYGFTLDKDVLKDLSKEIGEKTDKIIKDIYDAAGYEFNINSTKQLSEFLFDKLNLPPIKKTKTGYSTDMEVLVELIPYNEIVGEIIEYRQLMKLKSTYIDGFMPIMDKDDKVHSTFKQTVAATGRISSTEPNLQNIPVRDEFGRRIRKAFISSFQGGYIVSADYSQIELRVLAHLSEDIKLIESFLNNEDIHLRTASEVFKIAPEEVTGEMRRRAKAVNFGIVYGISDYGLSRDLKISRKEAKEYIDNYFDRYKGVKNYIDSVVKFARENGYVTTILNRRRYIPEINSKNYNQRSFGERMAMNTPIQGSAADIIKMSMVKVYNELKSRSLKSKLILQIHDELIVDTFPDEVEIVKNLLKTIMENVIKLRVPLVVDIGYGKNWYDAK
ncbi:DNA polymerase I [Thermoanaerobacterium thermosaccharolyticum]|jgi:DNA polymerase-1|uniref:DNA polymerase I n=2 Tax=Thermoanaerobacterium thermosaccharolyticum TaxID=1517 RepID=D9TNL6_THETC|nr:DNA polymerase I [Thermoanaerobacterium thermosaccharolyticum]ADL68622.1 DNA polymerase I [Thermoanaerobacterium thermosaccharolyticum DSM 571]AST56407.1 DNA polymerase I [Thermoanaerobacterium thermosaccharolyticum]OXT09319.1 DNA polymerase I [Thermoanaerobacterium thermosaccharolyticum]PHO08432.1 DNA polymerase I [Thermoanaerobacterium thermosaccharolyticum]